MIKDYSQYRQTIREQEEENYRRSVIVPPVLVTVPQQIHDPVHSATSSIVNCPVKPYVIEKKETTKSMHDYDEDDLIEQFQSLSVGGGEHNDCAVCFERMGKF